MTRVDPSFIQAPLQGVGVGLRDDHVPYFLQHWPDIPWLEIVSDNYLVKGGPLLDQLQSLRTHYPMAMHSVGLSIGSTDRLNTAYIDKLRQLADWLQPALVSDHLCWISVDDHYFHELLPLPYTDEALNHVVARIKRVQSLLGRRVAVENVSSYITYRDSTMTEWTFLAAVAEQADCYIVLDVNNVYVSSYNHAFDPKHYIDHMPADRVKQMHLAGFEQHDGFLLDAHNGPVHEAVWALYRYALERLGPVPTLIEWDKHLPELPELDEEAQKARRLMDEIKRQPVHGST